MCMFMLPLIGGVIQGIGALQAGMAQSAQYKWQAKALKAQAQGERNVGAYESHRAQERGDVAVSRMVTGMAAKGFDLSGTPGDIILDSATEVALDVNAIRSNAKAQSERTDFESALAKINSKTAKRGAYLSAIAPVISGISGTYEQYRSA
jgi:hypothetical protein